MQILAKNKEILSFSQKQFNLCATYILKCYTAKIKIEWHLEKNNN